MSTGIKQQQGGSLLLRSHAIAYFCCSNRSLSSSIRCLSPSSRLSLSPSSLLRLSSSFCSCSLSFSSRCLRSSSSFLQGKERMSPLQRILFEKYNFTYQWKLIWPFQRTMGWIQTFGMDILHWKTPIIWSQSRTTQDYSNEYLLLHSNRTRGSPTKIVLKSLRKTLTCRHPQYMLTAPLFLHIIYCSTIRSVW